jgi:hypothetical protein
LSDDLPYRMAGLFTHLYYVSGDLELHVIDGNLIVLRTYILHMQVVQLVELLHCPDLLRLHMLLHYFNL